MQVSKPNVKVMSVRIAQATKEEVRRGRRESRGGRGRGGGALERNGRRIQRDVVAQQARTQSLVWRSTLGWSTISALGKRNICCSFFARI